MAVTFVLISAFAVLIIAICVALLIGQSRTPQNGKPRPSTGADRARVGTRRYSPVTSGRQKLPLEAKAASLKGPNHAVRAIYGPDRIGIVGFHDKAFIIAVPAEPYAEWLQRRSQLLHDKVGGRGTNLTDGLRKAAEMLNKCPRGVLKRIWLLTDGYPNRETDRMESVLESVRRARVNVNTVGFGDAYDEGLLRRIAGATHNGKFVPVRTLRQLTDALLKSESRNGRRGRHQSETTILVIDLSPSMNDVMEGKRKVTVVEEAVLRLLHYKQECFA